MSKRRKPPHADANAELDAYAPAIEAALADLDGPARRRPAKVAASALRRGSRGWFLRYTAGKDAAGRRLRQSTFLGPHSELGSRGSAEQAAQLFIAKAVPIDRAPGASPPWPIFCAEYLRDRVPLMRLESQRTTRSVINAHVLPQFSRWRVHEITKPRVQAWIVRQREQRTPVSTIRHRVGILTTMLHAADGAGLTVAIPNRLLFPKSQLVKRAHAERTFTREEAAALLAAAEFPWRAAYGLALFAGLRASEITGIEWQHVDLTGRRLTIAQQAQHGEIVLPKSDDSLAVVDMPAELVELLDAYRHHSPADARFLFSNRAGKPLTSSTIRDRHLHPLCDRLAIPRRGLHAFRRRYADALAEAGATLPVMQGAMRHASPQTTSRYLSPGRRSEVTDAIRRAAATHTPGPAAD